MKGRLLPLAVGGIFLLLLLPVLGLLRIVVAPPAAAGLLLGDSPTLSGLLGQPHLWKIVVDTLVLSLSSTALAVLAGVGFAWLEQRTEYPGRRAAAFLTLLPMTIPSYLIAGTLQSFLGPGGWIGGPLGLPPFRGLLPAVLVLALVNAPFVQLLVAGAWVRGSRREEEAARGLGATRWRLMTSVILPRIRPAAGLGAALALIYIVSDFGAVAVLDAPVLTWRLYQAYGSQQLIRAAALGLLMLGLLLPLLMLTLRMQGGRADGRMQVANPEPPSRLKLQTAGFALAWTVQGFWILAGVLIPLAAMAEWMIRARIAGERFASLASPMRASLLFSLVGVVVILGVTAFLARYASGSRNRSGRGVDMAVFLVGGLPAVLIAFGLLSWFLGGGDGVGGLYLTLRQSLVLLMLGYLVKFSSQGYSGVRAAMQRLDRRHEEAALSMGASSAAIWRKIRLPLLAPGMAASAMLVFLMLLKELPLTLMLQPIGMQTLSFRVFDRYQEAFHHDAAAAGMMIVGLAWIAQLVTARWRRAHEGLG